MNNCNNYVLVPSLPEDGVTSMWKYANMLYTAMQETELCNHKLHVTARLNQRPKPLNKYLRFLKKKLYSTSIIQQVQQLDTVNQLHICDHSYAYLIPLLRPYAKKITITCHDIGPMVYPETLTKKQYRRYVKNVSCLRQADRIIAVSEYTKQCLIEYLSCHASQITVSHLGHSLSSYSPKETVAKKIQVQQQLAQRHRIHLLTVGSNEKRKNIDNLCRALSCLEQPSNYVWHRIGAPLTAKQGQLLTDFCQKGGQINNSVSVTDNTLANYYLASDILLLPSTWEGFGLPIIESMRFGCHVICSAKTALPEVAGNLADYFNDIKLPQKMAEVIQQKSLLNLRSVEQQLASCQYSQQFSWHKHAQCCFS